MLEATPRHPSGRPARSYRLKIELEPALKVWESPAAPAAQLLPRFCPERHVNWDGSFCLGLTRFEACSDNVADFWGALRAYLLCQDYSAIHGRWPSGRWLSHGDAAGCQLDAERAAAEAGLTERYSRALEFGEGWLAGNLTPRSSEARPRRRPPSPRRRALEQLLEAERQRRGAEAVFTRNM